ncbi:hypothetical protein BB427_10585 [Pseudoalteromonas sp. BMB]|nr:hypothetical protein BB427_10585 [Pseudoalteromonas sp. BMB]
MNSTQLALKLAARKALIIRSSGYLIQLKIIFQLINLYNFLIVNIIDAGQVIASEEATILNVKMRRLSI